MKKVRKRVSKLSMVTAWQKSHDRKSRLGSKTKVGPPMMEEEMDQVMADSNVMESTETNGINPSDGLTVGHDSPPIQPSPLKTAVPREPTPLEFSSSGSTSAISHDPDMLEDVEEEQPPLAQQVQVVVEKPSKAEALPYTSRRSGLVYDVRMRLHVEIISRQQMEDDMHPEDPRRIFEIYKELVAGGLAYDRLLGSEGPISDHYLYRIAARFATKEEVCLFHTEEHWNWVEGLQKKTDLELFEDGMAMDSVYLHHETFSCARLAAGGTIEACRAVVQGHVKNAVAVIRPPGHHAERCQPAGFCFFNNVSIAARVCQQDFPEKCRKIAIIDWDVHHGNGVQQAFYDDPNVLYISLHVHKNGTFYPSGPYGNHLHCGEGPGVGFSVNIPWSTHGMTDADYLYAFQQVIMPVLVEFNPDLVIVSSGFDAAEGDKLGGCHVSPSGYAHMTHMLMSIAKGKIAVVLEGGYNLRSIATSALAVTRTLMGEPPDRITTTDPTASGVKTVQLVKNTQSRYWKCLYPKDIHSKDLMENFGAQRMHDVVRAYQAKMLYDEFRMMELMIIRDRLSPSFKHQVLATENFDSERPLLIIFHDPPDALGIPHPASNKLELHNTWVTDVPKLYIQWATDHGFAVIDVNVPYHVTEDGNDQGYMDTDSDEDRRLATREMATYLWDNYVAPNENSHVFLMGVGAAYLGILDLISTNETCTDQITGVISFISNQALLSVRRPTDDNIATWYWHHSLVFVAQDHAVWDPDRQRKQRKKYGKLVRSSNNHLNEMLGEASDQVTQYLTEETEDWREEQERKQPKKRKLDPSMAGAIDLREGRASSVPGTSRGSGRLPPLGTFTVPAGEAAGLMRVSPKQG
ncbi:hypothetical protein P152DRAFT_105032 [Eremomyces bilateralis CBS 781.70]|uniref:histone deacetylase n=1 Tax=Eremomyces bilateralis CBS 781.70 TaxID=1392243 RepID=A0A6G1FX13_9PEZI|nr:uncharacterized protein P152DRAFT_105032 [Eremomyces bilateralis CBS 781.70]KAF1810231.1 hypothetical protein P152DRAFT_105032 [Eremomyces bilateralis CBS 781.70]